jgi:NAD(P)H-dependent flavin oxidoreductase YrpB (nitropropane dioxygenase family)
MIGMNVAAGPELAAAVTNAGGLGVIGGVGYTPKILRAQASWLIQLFGTTFLNASFRSSL